MDTFKINKQNVKMIAHRGVSGIEKENSMPAFIAAGNRSYFGIECDVHRTADGKFVIIHDHVTGRVADIDLSVEHSSYDTLRAVSLYDIDGKTRRCDLKIPNLTEYVNVCKRYNKAGVLELKGRFENEDITALITAVNECGYLDKIIFISFSIDNLIALRHRLPGHPMQWLTGDWQKEYLDRILKYDFDLDIYFEALNETTIHLLKAHDRKINIWTVDNPETAEKYAALGVDYITTNILE